MMKKNVLAIIVAAGMAMSLAACGGSGSTSGSAAASSAAASSASSAAASAASDTADASSASEETASSAASSETAEAGETIEIQAILNTTATEYWQYVVAGAQAYGEEHDNVEVSVVGPASQTSYDEQMNMIETALSSNEYDGLVISPLQADTTANMIANAEIPIVAVNTNIDSPKVETFVGTGNLNAAKEGGIAAVEAARAAGWEEINAICLAGTQGDPTGEERLEGFKQGIEEAGGTFLANETQYTNWDTDKAVASMEAVVQTHPEGIAIIVGCADDMALAGVRVADGNEAFSNTIFCGFDGNQAACESIAEGKLTMSVAQNPYEMGYKSVEATIAKINGESVEEFVDTGCKIIDQSNAQEQIDTLKGYIDEL